MKKLISPKHITCYLIALLFNFSFAQVGIGTTSPTAQLTVMEDVVLNESGNDNDFRVESLNRINMIFVDAGADRIGIGINNPAYALEMKLGIANNYIATFENTNATGASLQAYVVGTFNALGGVTNNVNGLASYGVSLPATGGSTGVWGTSNSSDANGVEGSIPTTGTWLGFGGLFTGGLGYINGLYNLSDERVKSNITTINDAITKLQQIEGVTYTYNLDKHDYLVKGDQKQYLGFLAQNIKEVFPEAVAEKQLTVAGPAKANAIVNRNDFKKETFNVVDYTAIIPVLVEGIKEQQVTIEAQNSKIQDLETKLLLLESKVNGLLETKD